MKHPENHGDYELLRSWALYPSFMRPAGLAALLGGGMITWLHTVQPLAARPLHEGPCSPMVPGTASSWSLLVAAMIAKVIL